ncbi:MAG: hypothetical protein LH654_09230 [Thermoleophilia bacterium]|nr:hypothetical protein [Thermoleophilia bacterium]
MAIQIEREVADAYGVTGTPAAILIGQDGLVESTLALGSGAIEALVPAAAPKRNETGTLSSIRPGVALVAGAAALAVAASAAGAGSVSEYGQEVDDPELVGLRVAIKLANPRLAADAREVHRALVALAGARNKHAAQAVVGTAMRKERQHLLELRAMLRAVPTSGERAIEAKQLAIRSLTLLANGRDRFARAVASPRASDSIRLLKQAQTPLQQARSLAYGANILLGCTGKDC